MAGDQAGVDAVRPDVRVCVISATFPPAVCGVGDYTFQLCRALSQQGARVTVLTARHATPVRGERLADGVDVRPIVPRWTVGGLSLILREITAGGYDLVHLQYTPNLYGRATFAVNLLPWWVAAVAGCPTLVTFHEVYTPYLKGVRSLLAGTYDRVKDTVLLLSSAAVVVTVPSRGRRLSRLFPWLRGRLHVIPVGAGLDVMRVTEAEREAQRVRLGVAPDEVVVGSFGALHPDKGYESFFRAVRRLRHQGHPVRGLIIGAYHDGHPYYERLKKYVADFALDPYIIWTGYGTPSDVSRWLAAVDVYVMTDVRGASERKSSLITALAHGLPIVSTRGPDTPEEFVSREPLVLVEMGDDDALVDQLGRLLQAPEERARLRAGARRLYESHYAWDRIAQQMLGVYQTYGPGAQR